MSLLGTQVYANPTTSCWVSVDGDTINGNLDVTGNITAGSTMYAGQDFIKYGPGATTEGRITADNLGTMYLQAPSEIKFTQVGQSGANSSIAIGTAGLNDDIITLGGRLDVTSLNPVGAGTDSIAAGQTQVVVACPVVGATSKIFLGRKGLGVLAPAFGSAQNTLTYGTIVPGVSFVVQVNDALGNPIPVGAGSSVDFDWLVIG